MFDINKISKEKYVEKLNDTVIDGITDVDYRITINKTLSDIRLPAKKYLNLLGITNKASSNFIKSRDRHRIYDHMHDCRFLIPGAPSGTSLNCMFSCPYTTIDKLREDVQEPWICDQYKIYLVNPRHYRYYLPNTLPLLHVEDLDNKYREGSTDSFLARINAQMMWETGEPLVYIVW